MLAESVNTLLAVFTERKEWGNVSEIQRHFQRRLLEDGWKKQAPVSSARKKFLSQEKLQIPQG